MKDFYKILGVKETASEEEIRARWVELTKRCHPDRGEDIASNEKIREINEAYQILKHSSTRVEYDLKRTYGQRKRESYFKRLTIPASILIISIIVGIIYLKNSQSPPVSELTVSNPINQIDQINQNEMPAQQPKIAKAASAVSIKQHQTNQTDQRDQINQINESDQIDLPREMGGLFHRGQINQNEMPDQQPKIAKAAPALQIKQYQTNQTDEIDQRDLKLQVAQFKPPSLLATEGEVKRFFDNYIGHYNQMDLEGFLSLFSSKAIQNKKDGLEGIRKIYADFFNQGQGVRYNMQDMKIEIYENVVEVKARYEIEQISKMGGEKKTWRGNVRWVLGKENGALKIISLDYQHQKSV